MLERILDRIEDRSLPLAIHGLGYVGLPLTLLFIRAGFKVMGYDTNRDYIASMRSGSSAVVDVPSESLRQALADGRLVLTSDPELLRSAQAHIICVPTPLSKSRQPDLSYIEGALATLLGIWEPGRLVLLESTTYPWTTQEMLLPALSQPGIELDRDFLLAFSPERVDPGNQDFQLADIPKVVGGVSSDSTAAGAALYQTIFRNVHPVSTATVAELSKLLENTFRNVNIALVNEFAQICETLGADVWEVIHAAKTKPFGFMPFYPGPGIGGHCIPLDPQYLVYKSRLSGYEPRLVALADQINQERPLHVVYQAIDQLNSHGKPLKGSRVIVLGAAYKPDVPDPRESPALPILEALLGKGADVAYVDPLLPVLRLDNGCVLRSEVHEPRVYEEADLIIIITPHSELDLACLRQHPEKVLDTRNVLFSGSSRTGSGR